ncbi:MAG: acyltransferase domain-containing protein, partial [Thermoplasmata archaeon]|nr:acyltransferase domain-containing protein [Thermoplasmata archaeon]
GALIASGVLTFEGALQAVSARGKEMRDLKVDDPGKMASVSAGLDKVEEVLKGIDGYVIAANKNCYVQTVIAGENDPMEEAVKRFKKEGIEAVFIPVSHAFHSSVVAPAKEPLRRFLSKLDISTPTIPLLSNVTADYYPMEGTQEEIKEQVLDLLKEQVASSVEWMAQIKRARKDGCNVFIEVGPKRALSSFAYNILEDEVKAGKAFPLLSNHPKKGGIATFNEMVGSLWSLGFDLKFHDLDDETYYNSDFSHAFDGFVKEREIRTQKPMTSIEPAPASRAEMVAPGKDADPGFASFLKENSNALNDFLSAVYKKLPNGAPALEEIRDDVDLSGSGITPPTRKGVEVVITGAAMGLPGKFKSVFSEDNLNLLVSGRNLIEKIEPEYIPRFIEKNIVRLDKKADGSAEMIKLDNGEKVAHLAGMLGDFDLGKEFDIPEDLVKHLDITTRLAFASGLLALKDAGIPLVRRYSQTSTGSFLPESWELPLEMQEDTGIVFATAFPGHDMLFGQIAKHMEMKISKARGEERERLYGHLKKVVTGTELEGELEGWYEEALKDPQAEYQFPRHFMFIVLAMGHSQFAQFLKAKGPNTQVNSACASSTLAVAIGQDWIQAGRCKRVLVLGADDPSSDNSLEWLGSSLLSLGALTTESDVTKAALPFDRRRKGMIIGSGAAALVLEAEEEPRRRGMNPLVEILGTHIGNSAFHGSRLDVAHIARSMDRFMLRIERETGIKREEIADDLIFMSHETYTPARGGSSAAEVESLRRTFGDRFRDILIMNTKGFTGHAFGACMEDPALIKALETGKSIPIANLNPSEVDKQFEGLQLSTGGTHNRKYGLRLAAGFGSQLSFLLVKRPDVEGRYISSETYQKWLDSIATTSPAQREDHPNVLRLKDQGIGNLIKHRAILRGSSAIGYEKETVAMGEDPEFNRIREEVIRIVAEKTGFEGSMLDIDSDMENELGFDTVKQVELFAAARIHFDLPKDEGVNLREYPTLRHFIEYIMIKSGSADIKAPAPALSEEKEVEEVVIRTGWEMVKEKVIAIVAEKTGYPEDMLELDLDLEADLGIDTVKQVELFGMARTEFDLPRDESVNLSEMPTLRHIIDYVVEGSGITDEVQASTAAPAAVNVPMGEGHPHWDTIRDSIVKIVAEKTGYPEDMLELDLDLEADLGIDTVKQVELFGMARTEFDLPRDESVNLSEMPTLRHIVDYVVAGVKYDAPQAAEVPMGEGHPHWDTIRDSIVKIVAEKTGYPEDM